MRPEAAKQPAYFDTPARAERLQLLLHLVRNADGVVYLRAPAGAGKTLFAHHLVDALDDDIASVWIRGGVDNDVASAAVAQLGLPTGESLAWPDGVLAAIGARYLLIIVDDADRLAPPAVERLAEMRARGGRQLWVGHGGLPQAAADRDVQFVDLPAFTVEQSTAFLRASAGEDAAHINDDLAGFLHHSAHGRPGPLRDALGEVVARAHRQAERRERHAPGVRPRAWLLGGAAVLVLGAVLMFQDAINAWFAPPPVSHLAIPAPTAGTPDDVRDDSPAPLRVERDVAPAPAPGQDGDVDPQTVPGLRPARVPPIVLPELSRLPSVDTPVGHGAGADRVGGDDEAVATAVDAGAADTAASTAAINDANPLEKVMRDARKAGGTGQASPADRQTGGAADAVEPATIAAPTADSAATELAPPAADLADGPVDGAVSPVADAAENDLATASAPAPPSGATEGTDAAISAGDLPPARPGGKAPVEERPQPPGPATVAGDDDPAPVVERRAPTTATPPPEGPVAVVVDGVEPIARRQAGPAPVEERPAATPPVGPPAVGREVVEAAAGDVAPATGLAWLRSRPPAHYTLQLIGARDRAALVQFVRDHRIAQPYAIFERRLDGRPWYSLVTGEYPGRQAALAARARLPESLGRNDIWPRTFASVQELIE